MYVHAVYIYIYIYIYIYNSHLHSATRHSASTSSTPKQGLPPQVGDGLSQVLVLFFTPREHVLEQELSTHSDQLPWTKNVESESEIISNTILTFHWLYCSKHTINTTRLHVGECCRSHSWMYRWDISVETSLHSVCLHNQKCNWKSSNYRSRNNWK